MNKRTNYVAVVAVAACVVALLWLSIRNKGPVEVDSGYRLVMGTFARIIAVAPDATTASKSVESAFAVQDQIEQLMSFHRADSELSKVNREAFDHPVRVNAMTFEVLLKAVEISRLSDGAFDVTVGPLVELWRRAGDANSPPSQAELTQARSKVGYEKLILDANQMTLRFTVEGMKLDLGGIAKGYAVDKSVEAMRACGATAGMVDLGGNIRCFGTPKDRDHWLIGVQDPFNVSDDMGPAKVLLILKLNPSQDAGTAVATSGHYRRFVTVKGSKQSHIIDTRTGHGSDKLASVTVVARDAMTADGLSTAVSVLGADKGLRLIEDLPQTEAILVLPEPRREILKSSGAVAYIK
jgi:thiamine biosynthesis lipoprotein